MSAITSIPTLQDEWKNYRDSVLPKNCSATQNKETHQAFFAGALVLFLLMKKTTTDIADEAECERVLARLEREVNEVNNARAASNFQGRN